MPEKRYFLDLTKYFLLGLAVVAIIIASVFVLIVFFLSIPGFSEAVASFFIVIFGIFAVLAAFVIVAIIVYVVTLIGVSVHYWFKHTTEWSREDKDYTIEKAEESGRRQKGESRKKQED